MVTPSCDRMKFSRDVCTPRALPDQWMTRYCSTSTNKTDRGYLHSEIAANSVQGSSTVTGSHEGEGGAWRLLIFSAESRRPDITRQESTAAAQDDRSRMNVRPWFGSAVLLACATHSFLGGGDKQLV